MKEDEEASSIQEADLIVKENFDLENGKVYSGQMYNSLMHGKGSLTCIDGSKYTGRWRFGKAYGRGKFEHSDGDVYDGEWKND
mmetsp:Transcript_40255/g.38725  ORF Transcript_40255/g.38725 Transcript_40255/m.38725 type:complete len:83 (+) Transcript_40255:456-704(+)